MNLSIVPRQIEKKTPKTHSLNFGQKKRKSGKKRIPLPMQRYRTPRKKFRFPLLPKEENYEINTVRTYSD